MRILPALTLFLIAAAAPTRAQDAPREVFVTADSAAGWIPSPTQETAILAATRDYFDAIDSGEAARAYAMLAPEMRGRMLLASFFEQSSRARDAAGPVRARGVSRITWSKDPPGAPGPGVYGVIDVTARHARIDRACGYLVWHQRGDGAPFKLMRIEINQIDNATADAIIGREGQAALDQLWAKLSANCPNYSARP